MTDEELIDLLKIKNEPGAKTFVQSLSSERRAVYERLALLHTTLVMKDRNNDDDNQASA